MMVLASLKTNTEKIDPHVRSSFSSGLLMSLWWDHSAMCTAVGPLPVVVEKLVVELHERTVKVLSVCNAAHDGID